MIVDCMTCPVRERRCEDCVVTTLMTLMTPGSTEFPLDPAESAAVSVFVGAGLVSAASALRLHARREPLDHWESARAAG